MKIRELMQQNLIFLRKVVKKTGLQLYKICINSSNKRSNWGWRPYTNLASWLHPKSVELCMITKAGQIHNFLTPVKMGRNRHYHSSVSMFFIFNWKKIFLNYSGSIWTAFSFPLFNYSPIPLFSSSPISSGNHFLSFSVQLPINFSCIYTKYVCMFMHTHKYT